MLLLTSFLGVLSCGTQRELYRPVTIETIENMMKDSGDSLYILNFWATWCGPCREELPNFDRITKEFASKKVKVFLISVDEQRFVDSHLKPFLRKHSLRSEVLWLDASDPMYWIDRVSASWGGNIPITIFVFSSQGIAELHDHEITYEELLDFTKRYIDAP